MKTTAAPYPVPSLQLSSLLLYVRLYFGRQS